jgi:hypothetical protein
VQVATDNPHLGLLRPERCEGGHRTVYAGRREADVLLLPPTCCHCPSPVVGGPFGGNEKVGCAAIEVAGAG